MGIKFPEYCDRLCLSGCANGANLSTVSAIDAGVSVDLVLAVTLGDSLNGALGCASTATDAIISNLKCHGDLPILSEILT